MRVPGKVRLLLGRSVPAPEVSWLLASTDQRLLAQLTHKSLARNDSPSVSKRSSEHEILFMPISSALSDSVTSGRRLLQQLFAVQSPSSSSSLSSSSSSPPPSSDSNAFRSEYLRSSFTWNVISDPLTSDSDSSDQLSSGELIDTLSDEYADWTQVAIVRNLLIVCYLFIMTLSLLGNTAIVYTVLSNRKMHTVVNYYIVNLAVCDLLVGVFVLPGKLIELTAPAHLNLLSDWSCTALQYSQALFVFASVLTLVATCLERYVRHLSFCFNRSQVCIQLSSPCCTSSLSLSLVLFLINRFG
jgi:hypothetical protein